MLHRSTISLFCAFALATAAAASPDVGSVRTGPRTRLASLLDPELLRQLDLAALELDRGNPDRAQAHATLAALPETIAVFVDTGDYCGRRAVELRGWTLDSIRAWNDAGATYFALTTDASTADVIILFEERVHGGRYAGYATTRRSARYGAYGYSATISATIEVSNRMPNGRLMGSSQVRKTVAHELGHVLGLDEGHSPENVMGPVPTWNASFTVSQEAVQALQELDSRARAYITGAQRTLEASNVPKAFTFLEPR